MLLCNSSAAEGITKEQGDAILKELRELRLTLERMAAPNQQRQKAQAAPAPTVVEVSLAGGSVIGNEDAPITLLQFTDYECPFCAKFFRDTLKGLKANYIDTGKVNLIVRDLPLAFHANAINAAHATRCAGEQDKFIAMHDKLYLHPKALQQEQLSSYAQEIGLDKNDFDVCMKSEKYMSSIRQGVTEVQALGITGTPTFVLGKANGDMLKGNKIIGAQPLAVFESQIAKLLEQEG